MNVIAWDNLVTTQIIVVQMMPVYPWRKKRYPDYSNESSSSAVILGLDTSKGNGINSAPIGEL